MKKGKILAWLAAVCALALCAGVLAACDDGGENNGGEKGPYEIARVEGNYYDISVSPSVAMAGTEITVTVETEPFLQVEGAKANGVGCTPGAETGVYTFTMPEENVTVTADVTAAPEILNAEQGMGWIFAPSEISVAGDAPYQEPEQNFSVTFGTQPVFGTIDRDGYITEAEVISLNEDIIPTEALSRLSSDDETYVYTAGFTIDLTKVKEGNATIVLLDNDHNRFISKEITVVPYGEVYKDEAWQVTVTADFSDAQADAMNRGLRIDLQEEESTYVYGSIYSSYNQYCEFTKDDLEGNTYTATFWFVPNRGKSYDEKHYSVEVLYLTSDMYQESIYYTFELNGGEETSVAAAFTENGGNIIVTAGQATPPRT